MIRFPYARAKVVRRVAAAAAVAAAGWTFATPPAVAGPLDPIVIEASDAEGDASYRGAPAENGVDLLGFSVTQDRAAKVVRGVVTLAGQVKNDLDHELRIGLGLSDGFSGCNISGGFGWVHIRHHLGTDKADYVVAAFTDVRADVAVSVADGRITFETPAGPGVFDRNGFRCIVVQTEKRLSESSSDFENYEDRAVGYAPAEIVLPPAAGVDPGNGRPAPIADVDGDGIRDGLDRCPDQPGAGTDGCETVTLENSIKLGTKRVIVDRLMESTAAPCPVTAKVVVKLGRKTYGRQAIGLMPKGKFCHAYGVVKLKKRLTSAKVTLYGTGVKRVDATVAKAGATNKKTKKTKKSKKKKSKKKSKKRK